MEKMYRELNAVRRRLRRFRELDGIRYGTAAGHMTAALCLAAGRLWPIESAKAYAAASLIVLIAAGWLWGLLHKIPFAEAARTMDRAQPGEERQDMMATALAFAGDDSLPARLQRSQAEEYAAAYRSELKQRLPFPPKRRWLIPASAGLLAAVLLAVLPNPMDGVVDQNRKEREWIAAQKEETDKLIEELEAKELEPLAKAALSEEMADLKLALDRSPEPEEALTQVEETMKALQEMSDKLDLNQRERAEWLEAWKSHPETEGLGKALEQKDAADLNEKMEQLRQKLPGLSKEERQGLAEALKRLAESAPENDADAGRLAEALKQAAAAIGSGEQAELALDELAAALERQLQAASAESGQSAAAAGLASALAKQGLGLAENMAASGLAVSDAWSMGGSAEQLAAGGSPAGSGGEPGGADGAPPGAGQGAAGGASGSGAGQGVGNGGGSGSGSGTGSGTGFGQGQGQGSGAGLGSGGRTLVTTPRNLQGSGNVQNDGGPSTGGSVQNGGESPIFDGVSRPYEEVYSDYAAEAKRSLDRKDLPQSMQSLVESYFTEIDPGS
ncbi:phage tail tape measure protein [Paenibacillus sp. M1]|uniref:Phage tail tape measure protein n=1 Tax=Paenibacillus haidiansis TaxID=1574488 RepID=A0ABU7VV12_9BACL